MRFGDQLAVFTVGVVAATLAALIPARTAARMPTLAALAGRRPQHPVPRRLVLAGLAGVAVGLGLLALAVLGSASATSGDLWAFVAILGGVCELLGACAIAPALVARLEPLAGRVRGSWRLAARGLARNRARTGAVVSAVAAAGALAVVSTALVRGEDQRPDPYLDVAEDMVAVHELVEELPTDSQPEYRASAQVPGPEAQAALTSILPGAERIELRTAAVPEVQGEVTVPPKGGTRLPGMEMSGFLVEQALRDGFSGYAFEWAAVADDQLLDLVGLSSAGRAALEEDGAVLTRRSPEEPQRLSFGSAGYSQPLRVVAAQHAAGRASELLVTEAFAREHDLTIATTELVYRTPIPLTKEQREQIEDLQLAQDPVESVGLDTSRYLDLCVVPAAQRPLGVPARADPHRDRPPVRCLHRRREPGPRGGRVEGRAGCPHGGRRAPAGARPGGRGAGVAPRGPRWGAGGADRLPARRRVHPGRRQRLPARPPGDDGGAPARGGADDRGPRGHDDQRDGAAPAPGAGVDRDLRVIYSRGGRDVVVVVELAGAASRSPRM